MPNIHHLRRGTMLPSPRRTHNRARTRVEQSATCNHTARVVVDDFLRAREVMVAPSSGTTRGGRLEELVQTEMRRAQRLMAATRVARALRDPEAKTFRSSTSSAREPRGDRLGDVRAAARRRARRALPDGRARTAPRRRSSKRAVALRRKVGAVRMRDLSRPLKNSNTNARADARLSRSEENGARLLYPGSSQHTRVHATCRRWRRAP